MGRLSYCRYNFRQYWAATPHNLLRVETYAQQSLPGHLLVTCSYRDRMGAIRVAYVQSELIQGCQYDIFAEGLFP